MGLVVERVRNPDLGLEIDLAVERALLKAADLVLAAAVEGAPTEPEPRHGVHLAETAYRRLAGDGVDKVVIIGFNAFWAIWQHERMDYAHEHGHAKFLELAVIEYEEMLVELLATELRKLFA